MSCKKCNNSCKCKKDVPSISLTSCDKPGCVTINKCSYYIDWSCVTLSTGIVLSDGANVLEIPGGTNLESFFQQYLIFNISPSCATKGNASKSVEHIMIDFDNNIKVEWTPVSDNDLASGYQVSGYNVKVKHINTNTTYTFNVPSNVNYYVVPVLGSMSFASGNEYWIWVETVTTNGTLTSTCNSVIKYLKL